MFFWFLRKPEPEPSKAAPFALSWYKPNRPQIGGAGLELTPSKITFRTPSMPPQREFDVEFTINERCLHAHVCADKPRVVSVATGYEIELACRFVGIPADDWDCLMRYLRDEKEADFDGPFFDPDKPDDEFRVLPMATQAHIIDDLVEQDRLNRPAEGVAPLIRMRQRGPDQKKKGMVVQSFLIRSRFISPENGMKSDFDTEYVITDGHAKSKHPRKKHLYSIASSRATSRRPAR